MHAPTPIFITATLCCLMSTAPCESEDIELHIPEDVTIQVSFVGELPFLTLNPSGEGYWMDDKYRKIDVKFDNQTYSMLKKSCKKVIETVPVTDENVGGPGFRMASISFGGTESKITINYGTVKPDPFPEPVRELRRLVEFLQPESER